MPASRFVDLADVPVVDGHCHPLLTDPGSVSSQGFIDLFSEARPGTMGAHVLHTGYFRRMLHELARRLGTEPTVDAVLERRRALGEGARHALAESRVAALLVDTGYPPRAMPLAQMRRELPCQVHEVFRIESATALYRLALPAGSAGRFPCRIVLGKFPRRRESGRDLSYGTTRLDVSSFRAKTTKGSAGCRLTPHPSGCGDAQSPEMEVAPW